MTTEGRRADAPSAGGGVVQDEDAATGAGGDPRVETTDDHRSFEQLVDELERITDRLAGGDLGIEAATELYEQAEHLHGMASARLAEVQQRIDRLRTPQ